MSDLLQIIGHYIVDCLCARNDVRAEEAYADQLSHAEYKRLVLATVGQGAAAFDRAAQEAQNAWVEANWR